MSRDKITYIWYAFAFKWLHVSESEGLQWWQAIQKAQWSQTTAFRQRLLCYQQPRGDVVYVLKQTFPPGQVIDHLDTLTQEQRLPRPVATKLQDMVLRHVSAAGTWI